MKYGLILLAGLLLLGGCGSDDIVLLPGTPPVISDLAIDPESVIQGAGGGEIRVTATYTFSDAEGDMLANRVCADACGGGDRVCDTVPIGGAAGILSGTVNTFMPVPTTCTPGDYEIDVTAIDVQGLESNTLQATFTITSP